MSYVKQLIGQSALTQTQIDSLVLYRKVLAAEISLTEAARRRRPRPVSVGAYQRVVKQGIGNLQQALVTILVGSKMELVKPDEFKKLLDLTSKSPTEMNEEQERAFVTLINALIRKIVM